MQQTLKYPLAFLREREVLATYLPVGKSTLWNMVNRGEFPRPIKISPRVTVWKLEDIQLWLDGLGAKDEQ